MRKLRTPVLAALAALAACAVPAAAAPTAVNLRIEGSGATLFEGPITTDGREVTTASGGTHKCDGTNGGVNPAPGGTPTTALDDAARATGFTWDGNYNAGFDDFFVERVGSDGQVGVFGSEFWNVSVSRQALTVGGCQRVLAPGEPVLWSYQQFGQPNLELSAPPVVRPGTPFAVQVHQYGDDGALSPSDGASVQGRTTGADGRATLQLDTPGFSRFKATKPGAVRSNAVEVCVSAAGQDDCGARTLGTGGGAADEAGSGSPLARDSRAPRAAFSSLRDGARYRRGPRVIRGRVEEDRALHQVYLRLRRIGSGGCRWFSGKREVWTRGASCRRARFFRVGAKPEFSYLLPRALDDARYLIDLKALDRSLNAGRAQVSFRVGG